MSSPRSIYYLGILLMCGFYAAQPAQAQKEPAGYEEPASYDDPYLYDSPSYPTQTAQEVINRFINAIGGRAKLETLNRVQTYLTAQYLGNIIYMSVAGEYPNKISSVMTMGGIEIYREEFNGQSGYMITNGVRQDFMGPQLEQKKYSSIFNEYLYYDHYGFTLELLGTIPYNYRNYYQILKTSPAGVSTYMYFDVETGLLTQTVEQDESYVIFDDYREVQGILFPHSYTMVNAMGEMVATVTNTELSFKTSSGFSQPQPIYTGQTNIPANQSPSQGPTQTQTSGQNQASPPPTRPSANNTPQYSHKYALVIGNSNYKTAPLRNPANDARAMANELRELGFDVMGYTDLSRKEMRAAIHKFGDKISANKGVGLFYYAGHGLQAKGINYLIPVDATLEKEYDIEDECVKADMVLRMLELYKNPMNIIILDACRNNPFSRGFRSVDQGLAQPASAPTGSIIAFATAPGKTASDGVGQNGLYTQELIKAMRQEGLSIEQVFKQVRINVLQLSGEKQSPWENSSLVGDFYFKR